MVNINSLLDDYHKLLNETENIICRRLLTIYGYPNNIVKECHPNMLIKWMVNNVQVAEMKVTISGFKFTIEHKVI
jgi:hypothetical protein